MFTFGLGSAGQLGHGGTKNLSTVSQKFLLIQCYHATLLIQPALVTAVIHKVKITIAAASVCHTVLVDSKGEISKEQRYIDLLALLYRWSVHLW